MEYVFFEDKKFEIEKTECHIVDINGYFFLFLAVRYDNEQSAFWLWEMPLENLQTIADLDGKRIHWDVDDDRLDDDTLGSDFDVACNSSGLNYWNGPDCSRAYGEIKVDFKCIEGSTYKIEASFTLSKDEDEMEDDEEESYPCHGGAEFTVVVDDIDPYVDCR